MSRLGSKGWTLGQKLGAGGFGVVYEVRCNATGELAVAKRARSDEKVENLLKEAELMSAFNHVNIIEVYDALEDERGQVWLIMEAASMSLRKAIENDGPWPSSQVIRRGIELLSALRAIHDQDIVHRDVHIDNVLVTYWEDDHEPTIKLTDFGISKLLDDYAEGRAYTFAGRRHEVAPELHLPKHYTTHKSDLYQAGLCMYFMLTGTPAISAEDGDVSEAVWSGIARERAEALGTDLGDIIAKMLRRRDDYRYKSAGAVIRDLRGLLPRRRVWIKR